jgi:hypothetical protein
MKEETPVTTCQHTLITSTYSAGVHCYECKEPLVSFFMPISRKAPAAGAVLYAIMRDIDKGGPNG